MVVQELPQRDEESAEHIEGVNMKRLCDMTQGEFAEAYRHHSDIRKAKKLAKKLERQREADNKAQMK